MTSLPRLALASAVVLSLVAGCGGGTQDEEVRRGQASASTGRGSPSSSAGPLMMSSAASVASTVGSSGGVVSEGALACVEVELVPSALTCGGDSDCTLVPTGPICGDTCMCPSQAANTSFAAQLASETQGIALGDCHCPALIGYAECLQGVCIFCDHPADERPACGVDAGAGIIRSPLPDAGTGTIEDAGGSCFNVTVTPADTACSGPDDCTIVPTGPICRTPTEAECGTGSAAANQSTWGNILDALQPPGPYPCGWAGEAVCIEGQCLLCMVPGQPSPAGCPVPG